VAVLTAALLAIGYLTYAQRAVWLVRYASSRLAVADEREVAAITGALAELGSHGQRELVRALASRRPVVARSARATLDQLLDDWLQHPPEDTWRERVLLAGALADEMASFSPAAQAEAMALLERLVDNSDPAGDVVAHRLTEAYERALAVLRHAPADASATSADRTGSRPIQEPPSGDDVASQPAEQSSPATGAGAPVESSPEPTYGDATGDLPAADRSPEVESNRSAKPPRELPGEGLDARPLRGTKSDRASGTPPRPSPHSGSSSANTPQALPNGAGR
jgi:hypothetical protein